MPRIVVLFYLLAGLWLAGFGLAAATDAAPWAVALGSLSLLAFLAVSAARIGAEGPRAGRTTPRHAGSARGGG